MQNINVKNIAVDLDGTLVDKNSKLLPKTKQALIEAQKNGINLILCSGRPIKSMLKLARELEIYKYNGIIISNNGAIGYDTINNKTIFDTPIEHDLVVEILKSFENRDIWPMIEDKDYFIVRDVFEGVVEYNGQLLNVTEIEARAGDYLLRESKKIYDEVNFNVNKILTIVEPKNIETIIEEFKERFQNRVHVVQTSPYFMEFTRPEINKAYGLKKLGIESETLMSFGDSMNDKEMLEYSKYPIAMGNAQQKLKEVAIYVTDDNNSEGIYNALKKFNIV